MLTIGHKKIYLKTIGSTNNHLIELAEKEQVAEGLVVVCEEQLNGKGQRSNSWISEPGKNLTFSLYLTPDLSIQEHFALSKMVSISIIDFLKDFALNELTIKWPNDIYIKDKKVGGILIENKILGKRVVSSVIGIGLNINQEEFTTDLLNPTSVINQTGNTNNLKECLTSLFIYIEQKYALLKSGNIDLIDTIYKSNMYRLNEFHEFIIQGTRKTARIVGVDEYGKLMLKTKRDVLFICDLKEVEYEI